MVIGRKDEQIYLKEKYNSEQSEFIAVYGRRRVGKTFLIRETFDNQFVFQHSGVANGTYKEQLRAFCSSLNDCGLKSFEPIKNWFDAFDRLKILIIESKQNRKLIFIDEMPWMDTARSNFVKAFEHFWNAWASARHDILLIICGSATSWIINKVINNHGGLHGRLTGRIALKPFTLRECELFAESRGLVLNRYQILEGYMIMGGIPYYWNEMRRGLSMAQNIDAIFFNEDAPLRNEFHKLYSSLFKNTEPYVKIIQTLGKKKIGLTREEIVEFAKIDNGGDLTRMLSELQECGFIRQYHAIGKKAKDALYQLIDNYTLFYFTFIMNNANDEHYWSSSIDSRLHTTWCGLAFERVCLQHVQQIKAALGISGVLCNIYSWHSQERQTEGKGAQIDLLIDRNDQTINLCEMKFSTSDFEIDKTYDEILRNKKAEFKKETKTRKSVHCTLVTTYGLVHNKYSDSVQSIVTAEELF